MTTPNNDRQEQARTYLEGIGLTDRPDEYGDGIHGWRCEHPDRYGRCDCLADAVADLAKLVDAAVKRGQAEALRDMQERHEREADKAQTITAKGFHLVIADEARVHADHIEEEIPDEH